MKKKVLDFFKVNRRRTEYLFYLVIVTMAFHAVFVEKVDLISQLHIAITNTPILPFIVSSIVISVFLGIRFYKEVIFTISFLLICCSIACLTFAYLVIWRNYSIDSIFAFAFANIKFSVVLICCALVLVYTWSPIFRQKVKHFIKYSFEVVVISFFIANGFDFIQFLYSYLVLSVYNFKFFLDPMFLGFLVLSFVILHCQIFRGISFYIKRKRILRQRKRVTDLQLPHIGIIIPAYNEEDCIVQTVESLLQSDYPKSRLHITVVSDGSSDNTVKLVSKYFDMRGGHIPKVKSDKILETEEVLRTYVSRDNENLVLISKINGGKHDALNCAMNHMDEKVDWVLVIDADCKVYPDSLKKLASETCYHQEELVALTGTILASNLENVITKIQQIEYSCSFFLNRASLSVVNGMMIVSGAFGLFRKNKVFEVGGYTKGLGEDMLLTLNLQKQSFKNQIVYVPEAILLTQMPFTIGDLRKQRIRWFKGLMESLGAYKSLAVNPKMFIGYWEFLCIEFLAPILAPFGLILIIANPNMLVSPIFWISFLSFLFTSLLQNLIAIILLKKYTGQKMNIFLSLIPLNLISMIWRNDALLDRKSRSWGHLNRAANKSRI